MARFCATVMKENAEHAATSGDRGTDNIEVVSCTQELHNDIALLSNLLDIVPLWPWEEF